MSLYFPKPYEPFAREMSVKVDLPNYATKTDLKMQQELTNLNQLKISDLASLKAGVDKLDIDKLVTLCADLSKLNDIVKNDAAKKTVYHKLVGKVNNNDTSRIVLKTKYDTDKSELEKKI